MLHMNEKYETPNTQQIPTDLTPEEQAKILDIRDAAARHAQRGAEALKHVTAYTIGHNGVVLLTDEVADLRDPSTNRERAGRY